MKYKVGDTVKIKSFDWYNKNKNFNGFVACNNAIFSKDMSQLCGKTYVIQVCYINDTYKLKNIPYYFSDDMFEEDIRKISIEIPEGYEIDRENSTFENIIFKKKRTINTYSDLEEVKGFSIEEYSGDLAKLSVKGSNDLAIFIDEKHAKSAMAMAKISQLMPYYGGAITDKEWQENTHKSTIERIESSIIRSFSSLGYQFLAFHTEEQRDRFMSFEENMQLIKDYFMIP